MEGEEKEGGKSDISKKRYDTNRSSWRKIWRLEISRAARVLSDNKGVFAKDLAKTVLLLPQWVGPKKRLTFERSVKNRAEIREVIIPILRPIHIWCFLIPS